MAKNSSVFQRNPNMVLFVSFVAVLIVNMIVTAIANSFFPENVVLGTMSLNYNWALFLSSAVIAVATVFAMPFMYEVGHYKKRDLMPAELLGLYLLVNIASIWLMTRAADVFGLGMSSWVTVLVFAVVLNFVQGLAMMGFQVYMDKSK